MIYKKRLDAISVDEEYFLFQSCAITNKLPGIESSTEAVCNALDIQLRRSDNQTCCGGSGISFSSVGEYKTTVLASARNLAVINDTNLNTLIMCNGCYKNLAETIDFLDKDEQAKQDINRSLAKINKVYENKSKIFHVLEVFYKQKDSIAEKIKIRLDGLNFAAHYGCHYLYGSKNHSIDDPFLPSVIEEMVESMGGSIIEYPDQRKCCGSGIMAGVYTDKEKVNRSVFTKIASFNNRNIDALIVPCPYCLMTLDRTQYYMGQQPGNNFKTPVLYLAQIIGLAMGIPVSRLGFYTHITPVKPLLDKLGLDT